MKQSISRKGSPHTGKAIEEADFVEKKTVVGQGQDGVMKVEEGVERSIAESTLILALGLNSGI